MGKYLSALLLQLLCTQTLSQIPGCRHMTPQRSTDRVCQLKKNLWIWPILLSSWAALLLALSAKSIRAGYEEWQSSSSSASLDNAVLNWVHQIVGRTRSLQGRVQRHYKVMYLYQRATPVTIRYSGSYQSWLLSYQKNLTEMDSAIIISSNHLIKILSHMSFLLYFLKHCGWILLSEG